MFVSQKNDTCWSNVSLLAFDEKHKACEILFHKGTVNIKDLPFCKHTGRGKVHAMMASHCDMEIERDK